LSLGVGLGSRNLAAKNSIETDPHYDAADDGGGLHVGRQSERIERRQQ
jgi:hypothetical protein